MRNLNHKFIEDVLKEKHKNTPCIKSKELMCEYELVISQLDTLIKNKFKKHELAQWVNAINWYVTLKEENKIYDYKARSIVYVELGTNIGNELSYEHLAVVLKSGYHKAFIVPCSSSDKAKKRLKTRDKDYILGTVAAGFPRETVLYIKDARWISKTRIKDTKRPPKVELELFNELYNRVFEDIFQSKYKLIEKQDEKIQSLMNDKDNLLSIMAGLNMEIESLTNKIKKVEKQRDEYYNDIDILTSSTNKA